MKAQIIEQQEQRECIACEQLHLQVMATFIYAQGRGEEVKKFYTTSVSREAAGIVNVDSITRTEKFYVVKKGSFSAGACFKRYLQYIRRSKY